MVSNPLCSDHLPSKAPLNNRQIVEKDPFEVTPEHPSDGKMMRRETAVTDVSRHPTLSNPTEISPQQTKTRKLSSAEQLHEGKMASKDR